MSRIIWKKRCGSPTASWCCRAAPAASGKIVDIPITRAERGATDARGKLLALQNDLWSLIREEAIDAEREVQHA